MLTIQKRAVDKRYYIYGGIAMFACIALVLTALVSSGSLQEKVASVTPAKKESSASKDEQKPAEQPAVETEEQQPATMTGGNGTVANSSNTSSQTSNSQPASSNPPASSSPQPSTEPSPTPSQSPEPTPSETPAPSESPEPTDPIQQ